MISFLCALGAGILSAWGVGGGTLLLLVMTLFLGVDQQTAQGINLLFFLPTAAGALVCHWKHGDLDRPALRRAAPAAVGMALLGAWLAAAINTDALRRPFGVYLLASGVLMLLPKQKTGD